MPDKKRYEIAGIPQLVSRERQCGDEIFLKENDYRTYLANLLASSDDTECTIQAYRLTPREAMFLCTPSTVDGVARMMQALDKRYERHFNSTYGHLKALWSRRYKACLVEPGKLMLACYSYVEAPSLGTPDLAGPVWSSYDFHANGKANPVLKDHWVYRGLAGSSEARQKAYRRLVGTVLNPELVSEIERALNHSLVLGSDAFKDEISAITRQNLRKARKGRPANT